MAKETKSMLPPHLMDLLNPTPSGTAKLIAAWEGLSVESQIQIFTALDEAHFPWDLQGKVLRKALDSSNVYVRYLAAKDFRRICEWSEDYDELRGRIENDPDPLVKYCLLETKSCIGQAAITKNPEAFFSLPQEARLAAVREIRGGGEAIATLITYAANNHLEEGKVSETELYEILEDYLNRQSFRKYYGEDEWRSQYDGYGEFRAGKDIDALWALVVKVPEDIAHLLINHLPDQAGLNSGIPQNILGQLTPQQLSTLLYRKDIVLKDFRREVFKRPADRLDAARCGAISYNFDLSYEEFSEILNKPDREKIDTLRDLTMTSDLSLVFYEALGDILPTVDDDRAWEDSGMARIVFDRKAKNLTGWQGEKQLRELRLYRLAERAIPWKADKKGYPPGDELAFLANFSVDGDTWATFKNYSREWSKEEWKNNRLEKFLPRIYEIGKKYKEDIEEDSEEDSEEEVDNDIAHNVDMVERIEEKFYDVFTSISKNDEEKDESLMEALDKLKADATDVQKIVAEGIGNLKSEVSQVRAIVDRQKVLLYVLIGLLVWLLIAKF